MENEKDGIEVKDLSDAERKLIKDDRGYAMVIGDNELVIRIPEGAGRELEAAGHEVEDRTKKEEPKPEPEEDPVFGPVIYRYTRAQAIEDGVLADVSEMAKEVGFTMPVAVTSAVHEMCVVPRRSRSCEDYRGRMKDVLWMLRCAIRGARNRGEDGTQAIMYRLKIARRIVTLKALCGPGDNAEPVITIMKPEED